MRISVTKENGIFVLNLEGRLDHKGAKDLEQALEALRPTSEDVQKDFR